MVLQKWFDMWKNGVDSVNGKLFTNEAEAMVLRVIQQAEALFSGLTSSHLKLRQHDKCHAGAEVTRICSDASSECFQICKEETGLWCGMCLIQAGIPSYE